MISQLAEENRALDEKIKRVQVQKEREREELLKHITDGINSNLFRIK